MKSFRKGYLEFLKASEKEAKIFFPFFIVTRQPKLLKTVLQKERKIPGCELRPFKSLGRFKKVTRKLLKLLRRKACFRPKGVQRPCAKTRKGCEHTEGYNRSDLFLKVTGAFLILKGTVQRDGSGRN
jgi:hypothetical protein